MIKPTSDPALDSLARAYERARLAPPGDPAADRVCRWMADTLRATGPVVACGRAYRWDHGAAAIYRDPTERTARRGAAVRAYHSEVYPRGQRA